MTGRPFTIGLDLDDTTRDLYSQFQKVWKHVTGLEVTREQCSTYELKEVFRHPTIDPHALFFKEHAEWLYGSSELLPNARRVMEEFVGQGIRLHIVSSQPNHEARMLALSWLAQAQLPISGIIFTHRKQEAGADLYIDDAPHHLRELQQHGCRTITYDAPYNQDVYGPRVRDWLELREQVLFLDYPRWREHQPPAYDKSEHGILV